MRDEPEGRRDLSVAEVPEGVGFLVSSATYEEKIASATRIFGSSFLAGVPVFERERLTDRPKEPLSGMGFRARVLCWVSELLKLRSAKVQEGHQPGDDVEDDMEIEEDIPREDHCIWALDSVFSYI